MKKKTKFTSLFLIGAFLLMSYILIYTNQPFLKLNKNSITDEGNFLSLVTPAFAQSIDETFPGDEAGISAYVNVGQSIDLDKVKEVLQGVEAEGDGYIIGILELEGLPEEQYPHLYVNNDGWIVTYYSKYAPTSLIMQWSGYDGGTITSTTLEDAIIKISLTLRISYSAIQGNIEYYHFLYSDATTLVLTVDTIQPEDGTGTKHTDSFIFSIPADVLCYETSWLHYVRNFERTSSDSTVAIDDEEISVIRGVVGEHQVNGIMKDAHLIPDRAHTVSIEIDMDGYARDTESVGIAVAFVYQ